MLVSIEKLEPSYTAGGIVSMGVMANGYGVSFGVKENVHQIDCGDEYTKNHWLYTLNRWIVWYVNFIFIKFYVINKR